MGNLQAGLTHLEKVSLYDPVVHSGLTSRYLGFDARQCGVTLSLGAKLKG